MGTERATGGSEGSADRECGIWSLRIVGAGAGVGFRACQPGRANAGAWGGSDTGRRSVQNGQLARRTMGDGRWAVRLWW
jgi:hypothetical protein